MDADRMVTLTPKPGVGARPAAAKDNYQKMFKEQGCDREYLDPMGPVMGGGSTSMHLQITLG